MYRNFRQYLRKFDIYLKYFYFFQKSSLFRADNLAASMINLFGERLRSRREMVIRSAEAAADNVTADAATAAAVTSAATTAAVTNAITADTSTTDP